MKPNGWGLAVRALVSFSIVSMLVIVGSILFSPANRPIVSLVPNNSYSAFGGALPQEPLTLYQSEWNIYASIFKEPFETAVFLFRDGAVLTFSTHEAGRVGVAVQTIVEWITKTGRDMKNCLRVVHNHFTPAGFTDSDKYTYNYLKSKGFNGIFGIYYTATGIFQSID